MRRILLGGVAALLATVLMVGGAWAFGVKDVIQMQRDGIPDSLVLQKIEHSGTTFHLDAKDMKSLRAAGVSDEVISAMLATEDQDRRYGPYAYPGYPYPYSYYPYYYPRVVVGLGFGYYGRYHRYAPYYYRPYRPRGYFPPIQPRPVFFGRHR